MQSRPRRLFWLRWLLLAATFLPGGSGAASAGYWVAWFPCPVPAGQKCSGHLTLTSTYGEAIAPVLTLYKGSAEQSSETASLDKGNVFRREFDEVHEDTWLKITESNFDDILEDLFITAFVVRESDNKIAAYQVFPLLNDSPSETFLCATATNSAGFVSVFKSTAASASLKWVQLDNGVDKEFNQDLNNIITTHSDSVKMARVDGGGVAVICGDRNGFAAEMLTPMSLWSPTLIAPSLETAGHQVEIIVVTSSNSVLDFSNSGLQHQFTIDEYSSMTTSFITDGPSTEVLRIFADYPVQGHLAFKKDGKVDALVTIPPVGGLKSFVAYSAPDILGYNYLKLFKEGAATSHRTTDCGFKTAEAPSTDFSGFSLVVMEDKLTYGFIPGFRSKLWTDPDPNSLKSRIKGASFLESKPIDNGALNSIRTTTFTDAKSRCSMVGGKLVVLDSPFGDWLAKGFGSSEYLTQFILRNESGTLKLYADDAHLSSVDVMVSLDDLLRVPDDANYTLHAFLLRSVDNGEFDLQNPPCNDHTVYVKQPVAENDELYCLKRKASEDFCLMSWIRDNYNETDLQDCEDVELKSVNWAVEIDKVTHNGTLAQPDEIWLFQKYSDDEVSVDSKDVVVVPSDVQITDKKRLHVHLSGARASIYLRDPDDDKANFLCDGLNDETRRGATSATALCTGVTTTETPTTIETKTEPAPQSTTDVGSTAAPPTPDPGGVSTAVHDDCVDVTKRVLSGEIDVASADRPCCCQALKWERRVFEQRLPAAFASLCGTEIPLVSEGESSLAEPPTQPPLADLPAEEQQAIKDKFAVVLDNYNAYVKYQDSDCSSLTSDSERQMCEISKDPQLRVVNDKLSTQPAAVQDFKTIKVLDEEIEGQKEMTQSFTNIAVIVVVALLVIIVIVDLPLSVLAKMVGVWVKCRKPKKVTSSP